MDAVTSNYSYDDIYQLTQVTSPQSQTTSYAYDELGNRSSAEGKTYSANNLNQYTTVDTTTYSYDDNGNLINDGTWVYAYDYENRLISASKTGTTATYKYDAFGRRIQKEVTQDAQLTTHNYIYDGDQIIAEYDGSGNLTAKYIYGPGIDEPISTIRYPLNAIFTTSTA